MNKSLWAGLWLAVFMLGGCEEKREESMPAQSTSSSVKAGATSNETVNTNTLSISPNAAPQATTFDPAVGKRLHDQTCISCHDSGMYTRKDRKITDFPSLLSQVKRCNANLETTLFDEDIEQIAHYLNQTYYHFKP